MAEKSNSKSKLSDQRKEYVTAKPAAIKEKKGYVGNTDIMISTGSTLLDLAICGTRVKGGGIPSGIFVEVFGESGTGKTVLLSEVAGNLQRLGGEVMFHDPEARLNRKFAEIFDLDTQSIAYKIPNTVSEVFREIPKWEVDTSKINGIFADSLAALSTDMEMEDDDKMGMRRAKEFSQGFRKTCRYLQNKNMLMMGTNQIRVNQDAGSYGQKWTAPGGKAIAFYSSLRLRFAKSEKIYEQKTVKGRTFKKVIGIKTRIEVYKSSIDSPYRDAEIYIIFDYGIDNIRANLQYVKDFHKATKYYVEDIELAAGMETSIKKVEAQGLESKLNNQVISIWEEIQGAFKKERKKKTRV